MKQTYIVLLVVVLVGVGAYFMLSQGKGPALEEKTESTAEKIVENESDLTKPFEVEGGMFYFKPNEIKVKKGETVTVKFTNKEGMHDFVVDEFNAKTKQIKAGETETISFVADKAGTFEYYCSVGEHRAKGMVGKLIVE